MKIAVLPGDGIGPEIMDQAIKLIDQLNDAYQLNIEYNFGRVGADAIDHTGNPYPRETHELCMQSDAVLFGAIGSPKYDNDPHAKVRPEQGLLAMRKALGLYANVRPLNIYDALIDKSPLKAEVIEGTDFVVIRELTGGIYFGEPRGRSEDGNTAFDSCVYNKTEIERIAKYAFNMAAQRKGKLCMVDKANVLATSRLWREVVDKVAQDYPNVEYSKMFVDNAAMQMIMNPKQFDVILTENMFGDILTDEASVLGGSMGLLPSASVGKYTAVFEPIHGSFPEGAGKGIANPIAMILSVAMLFDYLDRPEIASMIRFAVQEVIEEKTLTPELGGNKTTAEVGDAIVRSIEAAVCV